MVEEGKTAWKLYQHVGLPKDSITDICSQRGFQSINWAEFDEYLEEFKRKSQGPSPFAKFNLSMHVDSVMNRSLPDTNYSSVYTNQYELKSEVLYAAQEGSDCVLVTRETCFYPQGGGQVSDTGTIRFNDSELEVLKVVKMGNHVFHLCKGQTPPESALVDLKIDTAKRKNCTVHHTAAHLLNAALKEQLGEETSQKGSLVDEEHFRLDVSSKAPVDIQFVEDFINDAIKSNYAVKCHEVPREAIMSDPSVIKLRNEVYPPRVRLVQCGSVSSEPCCGTHVASTGEIPLVVILNSRSAGANTKVLRATASRGSLARENAERLRLQIEKLDELSKELPDNFWDVHQARKQVSVLRNAISEELLPQLDATKALNALDDIANRIAEHTRRINDTMWPVLRARLMALRGNPIVGSVALDCDDSLIKPLMKGRNEAYFVMLQSSGRLYLQCKTTQSDLFTAAQWTSRFLRLISAPETSSFSRDDRFQALRTESILSSKELEQAARDAYEELMLRRDEKGLSQNIEARK